MVRIYHRSIFQRLLQSRHSGKRRSCEHLMSDFLQHDGGNPSDNLLTDFIGRERRSFRYQYTASVNRMLERIYNSVDTHHAGLIL